MSTTLLGRLLLGALYTSIAVAILATAMLAMPANLPIKFKIHIANEDVSIVIADTKELQDKGLSGYKKIGVKEGMLFIFPIQGLYGFWMKDMEFPIDIIWFNDERKVVDVWENAAPSSYPEVRVPSTPAKYVLEVKAGFYSTHGLKKGDTFSSIDI